MESSLALALAEKLRRIYEKDDTFLTYPLGVGFSNRALGFMKGPSESGLGAIDQLREKVAFARNVNIVPDDSPVFPADASELLWTRVQSVLKDAEFAESGLTAEEEKDLETAIDFLTDSVTVDGGIEVSVNSPILNRYYVYKTAFDAAEAQYLGEKISVETSTGAEGEALKATWDTIRERQLLDALQRARDDLNNLGLAVQVRAALQTRNDLELKKYLHLYRAAYENDISLAQLPDADAGGIPVYATFFSPHNIFEPQATWNEITLTRSELEALARSAAPTLKNLFGAGQSIPIETVTLEYTNVAVVRPWFRPEFFASRTWRFSNPTVVSNGGRPRQGMVPGYITSILAARNITVTRAAGASKEPMCIPIIAKQPITAQLKGENLKAVAIENKAIRAALEGTRPPQKQPQKTIATVSPATVAKISPMLLDPKVTRALVMATQTPAPAPTKASRSFTQTPMVLNQINATQLQAIVTAKQVGTVVAVPPAPPPPPKPVKPQQEQYGFDGIIVLAYVCKRVPRSPDPDPSLPW